MNSTEYHQNKHEGMVRNYKLDIPNSTAGASIFIKERYQTDIYWRKS